MNEASLGGVLQRLAALIGIEVQQLEAVAQSMKTVFGPHALEQDDAPLSILALWGARRAQSLSQLLIQLETRGQASLQGVAGAPVDLSGPYDGPGPGRPIRADHPALRPPPDYDREHPELHAGRTVADKAPVVAQVRDALVLAEWGNPEAHEGPHNPRTPTIEYAPGYLDGTCPVCAGRQWNDGEPRQHERGCAIDTALTAAGLPDQSSREAERDRLAGDINR